MASRSLLERLGFGPQERVVLLHADDLGMCHAANAAFAENLAFGITTCGAVMAPCPWFPELAAYCREHPQADVGVHVTLTSEWQQYRWRPLSTRDPASGLLDEEGYLPHTVQELHARMDVNVAIAEIRAQVEWAIAAGIDVTHLDTHMGAVGHPQLAAAYVQLGLEFRLPVMIPRLTQQQLVERGASPQVAASLQRRIAELEASGVLVLDHIRGLGLREDRDRERAARAGQYRRAFAELPPGVTHFLYHPARPGDEIMGIAGDWASRVADYQALLSVELRDYLAASGIHLIGYRRLRDLMR